jgi:hypothetical protein
VVSLLPVFSGSFCKRFIISTGSGRINHGDLEYREAGHFE